MPCHAVRDNRRREASKAVKLRERARQCVRLMLLGNSVRRRAIAQAAMHVIGAPTSGQWAPHLRPRRITARGHEDAPAVT